MNKLIVITFLLMIALFATAIADEGKKDKSPAKTGLADLAKSLEAGSLMDVLENVDADHDGVLDNVDNCVGTYNPGQYDVDWDGVGEACDNCCDLANPDQSDIDGDGLGDLCDSDMDGDGVDNSIDNCPKVYNPDQSDEDGNGVGDVCSGCCEGIRGDIAPYPVSDGLIDIADLVFMVDYQFRSGHEPACFEEGDVNADGVIDITDLVCLVNYSFMRDPFCEPQPCGLGK